MEVFEKIKFHGTLIFGALFSIQFDQKMRKNGSSNILVDITRDLAETGDCYVRVTSLC